MSKTHMEVPNISINYNILVSGGAGYLGSILVPELLKLGNKVTVLDNFMFSPTSLLDCCHYNTLEVIRGDARDKALIQKLVSNKDIIIPLAALVGAPLCNRDKIGADTTNRGAIKTLAEVISKEQRIIIPTTNSGYGIGQKDIHCTEETPLNPISFYGITKVEAEKIVLDRGNSISLRLATVFGISPRMRVDLLVNDFAYRAVKDRFIIVFEGHFKRNYIHVRDTARAFIHAIKNFDQMKDEPYNVGLSDANISKLELCAKIKEQLPDFVYLEAPVGEDPDKRDYIVSNEKIERTGFVPKYSLEMGIRELIKGYTIITNSKYSNV
jgi:nucleoside-diphosphate-sugar epimerase